MRLLGRRFLDRGRFCSPAYLVILFDELATKLRGAAARIKKPDKEYYSADYPDDWTL